MHITIGQISPKLSRVNLDNIIEIVKDKQSTSDLIVFPELSLNGYMLQDKLYEDAWNIDELDTLLNLSKDVDIVVGCALKDNNVFRNAALYLSKGRVFSKHIKVHLPNYGMFEEARYFEGGNSFDSFIVNDRVVSMLICEDLWHSSVHQELIKINPDQIIVLVASPARGFHDDGLEIQDKWYKIITQVAKECKAELIFANRVGFEDGLGFWGGSCIVNSDGNIIQQLPLFEIDIKTFKV